jgi:hypothetical protein
MPPDSCDDVSDRYGEAADGVMRHISPPSVAT